MVDHETVAQVDLVWGWGVESHLAARVAFPRQLLTPVFHAFMTCFTVSVHSVCMTDTKASTVISG